MLVPVAWCVCVRAHVPVAFGGVCVCVCAHTCICVSVCMSVYLCVRLCVFVCVHPCMSLQATVSKYTTPQHLIIYAKSMQSFCIPQKNVHSIV